MGIILAILIFCVIVIFHEFGHFLTAKRCDVQVNEFMIGLGPRLFGVQRGETLFSVHLLPFGGACAMEGEDGDSDNPRAFFRKPAWKRLLIVVAGPGFNFLMAFLLSIVMIGMLGIDYPTITGVMEGYPAEEAGLKSGDTIVKLNSKNIHFARELTLYLIMHENQEVRVTYERDGERIETTLVPRYDEAQGRYLFGVLYSGGYEKASFFQLFQYGWYEVEYWIWSVFGSLKMLLTGMVGLNDLAGPVGIVKTIGDTYTESKAAGGAYAIAVNMLNISIMLSANLGVMNLLPIPGLDGGRILLTLIEMIRRKRMPIEKEGLVNLIGLGVLLTLMAVVMVNDIRKIVMGI